MSSAVKNVMELFRSIKIDWSEVGINDGEKSEAEWQKVKAHRERKRALGHRLGTLQLLLKRHVYYSQRRDLPLGGKELEDFVDSVLRQHNYDLDDAIQTYHAITPEPAYICKCGRRAPFCSCEGPQVLQVVSCAQCVNFEPNVDRLDIGVCKKGLRGTEEAGRWVLLYPNMRRHCIQFGQAAKANNDDL